MKQLTSLLEKVKVMVIVSNEVLDEPLSDYEYGSISTMDWTNPPKFVTLDEAFEMEYGVRSSVEMRGADERLNGARNSF